MAIIRNVVLRGARKRIAGIVTYQRDGLTLARELPTSVTNPRTESQMNQRVKLANLVNFYKANSGWMQKAFQGKIPLQSDYNRFTSTNLTSSRVALTKEQASLAGAVVAPYMITKGSLPSIQLQQVGDYFTGPVLNTQTATQITTIGQLADAMVGGQWRYGDQLSLIRMTQQTNDVTGVPYIQVRAYELILKKGSTESIYKYMPADIVGCRTFAGVGSFFCVLNNGNDGGFALIQSRTIGGRTLVSTQSVQMVGTATLNLFSSPEQIDAAIASYGSTANVFLDSDTANVGDGTGTQLSVVAVKFRGQTAQAGGNGFYFSGTGFSGLEIEFTSTAPEPYSQTAIYFLNGVDRVGMSSAITAEGNKWLVDGTSYNNAYVSRMQFSTADNISFDLAFKPEPDDGNLDD